VTWQPLDCHAHTTMSDGALDAAELVSAVRARGVRPSVADHISRDVKGAIATVDGVREYLDVLDRYPVARGGEFCWHDSLWREIPPELAARFTHHIGSLHAVYVPGLERPLNMFSRRFPDGLDADAYMDAHLESLDQFAREMPVDILAHPTLLPLSLRDRPLEELWTEAREERAVNALVRARIAFEVSSRYRPHARFVRRAFERGVRLSLGSDGHQPDQVGDISFSIAMTRSIGVSDDQLYDPAVHGSRPWRV
jgi:histidinol phosphatase-like PHP family hydrolase